jgi:xanthine dehydrogenase small subunit
MSTPEATVNGRAVPFGAVPPHITALDWIRGLGYTGAKEGCAEGECGACAIMVARPSTTGDDSTEWVSINACLIPAASLDGHSRRAPSRAARDGCPRWVAVRLLHSGLHLLDGR